MWLHVFIGFLHLCLLGSIRERSALDWCSVWSILEITLSAAGTWYCTKLVGLILIETKVIVVHCVLLSTILEYISSSSCSSWLKPILHKCLLTILQISIVTLRRMKVTASIARSGAIYWLIQNIVILMETSSAKGSQGLAKWDWMPLI